jgi:serine/threonine protein kinase
MHPDDHLDALLDSWQEARTRGVDRTPAELCRDTPELLPELERRVAVLGRFEALRSDTVAETAERPPAAATTLPDAPLTQAAPPAARRSALPAVGADFDGYRIVAELGRGGMGCVLRATNPLLRRDEALKVMLPEVAARPKARERFLREARAMAALRHDHVVEVYHVREAEGVPYLAMPLLEGETLAARLKREKVLPPVDVVRIGRQMADGLAAAHAKGLIHRDLKQSNVWLEAGTDRVKLLDFGLAREEDAAGGLTGEGAVLGTPAYMSPEQANGEALDARSDLFSVGAVLYECATGRPAFTGPTVSAVLSAVALKDPKAARTVNPQVPAGLSDLIGDLLHKAPDQRPASAQELGRRLRALEAGDPAVEDRTPTTEFQPAVPRRRWPWVVAAACLLGLGLLGALALSKGWLTNSPSEKGPGTTEPGPGTAPPPPAADPLRVVKIEVRHFARIGADNAAAKGLIGERSFAATEGDQVTVEARLSRPAYAYLIAFRPDGVAEVCFPENEDEPPPLTDRPRYPVQNRDVRYGLSDGAGLMVFAVVASDRPLPSYREWSAQYRPAWRPAEGTPGEVWQDDGSLLDILTPAGPARGERGKGEAALGRSMALVRLTDSLKKDRPTDAVACLGFVVRPR